MKKKINICIGIAVNVRRKLNWVTEKTVTFVCVRTCPVRKLPRGWRNTISRTTKALQPRMKSLSSTSIAICNSLGQYWFSDSCSTCRLTWFYCQNSKPITVNVRVLNLRFQVQVIKLSYYFICIPVSGYRTGLPTLSSRSYRRGRNGNPNNWFQRSRSQENFQNKNNC